MAASDYTYDPEAHAYRDKAGKLVSVGTVLAMRDTFLDRLSLDEQALDEANLKVTEWNIEDLAADLFAGRITLPQWEEAMRQGIQDHQTALYLLGRGGANAATDADHAIIADVVDGQWGYLSGFARDIADGVQSEAQVVARAAQYIAAGVLGHSQGHARSYGMDLSALPAWPGDGDTACRGNCRCAWVFEEDENEYRAYWQTVGDERECSDCEERATRWSPYTIRKSAEEAA